MRTSNEGIEHALERLRLAREIMRTPVDADAEFLNKALDYAWSYVATAMGSLYEALEILEEEQE